jgi:hypothetical protein
MKRFLIISIFMSLLGLHGISQPTVYKPGESIRYTINYGIISAGEATMELTEKEYNGKTVWHSKLTGRTTGMADALFKVIDIYESYMEPETGLPVFTIRNISEGRYKKYNEVIFDHYTRSDSTILTSDLTGVHIAQKGILDILSCFYHFRNNIMPVRESTIKRGDVITIMTWFADELYPIKLKYVTTEEIKTKAGRIKCHKFNPVTEKGRLFKSEEAVSFWFSADKNFLPVKIRFDIFVGAFTVEMVSYQGTVFPLEIRK